MKRSFQVFAYVFLVIIGGYMFGFTADGRIIKICIACNSLFTTLTGIIAMFTGLVGLGGTIWSKKDSFDGSLNANA